MSAATHPESIEYQFQLGMRCLRAKDPFTAICCFDRVLNSPLITVSPDPLCDHRDLRQLATFYLGESYMLVPNVTEAERCYRMAIEQDDNMGAHYALGRLLEARGDFQAIHHYCRAAKLGITLAEERIITLLGILHTADKSTLIEVLRRN